MEFSDYVIFVDESGDHNLNQSNVTYPIFALAFCIFKKVDYIEKLTPALQNLKFKWFGHDALVLHEREVRKRERPFDRFHSKQEHLNFLNDMSLLISSLPMTVIAAVIKKDMYKSLHTEPQNPYELALQSCIENTVSFLNQSESVKNLTHIIVECRGKTGGNGDTSVIIAKTVF